MSWKSDQIPPRLIKWVILLAAAPFLGIYIYIALSRITYPYELEWMEGGVADHVIRLLEGKSLYVAPSLDFVPYIYTPFYYYVCAPLFKLLGSGLLPLRLVSFVSSLACFTIIFAFVRRETRATAPAFLATCLLAATYPLSGFWFDVGRIDTLFMALLLGGIHAFRSRPTPAALLTAAGLFILAFFTKQTALLIALPLALYSLLFLPPRLKLIFPATFFGLTGMASLAWNWASGGWFGFYVFTLPRQHGIIWEMVTMFWSGDLRPLAWAGALTIFTVAGCLRQRQFREAAFHLLLAGGMILAAWLSRLHSGGYLNVLMPAYAALAIYFGLGISALLPGVFPPSGPDPLPFAWPASQITARLQAAAGLACLAQFAILIYPIAPQIPTPADRKAGDTFIQYLRAVRGEVYLPYHGYLTRLAGKPPHAQAMAVTDIYRSKNDQWSGKLRKELRDACASKRFALVIYDNRTQVEEGIEGNYVFKPDLFKMPQDVFFTFTGCRFRPESFYLPAK